MNDHNVPCTVCHVACSGIIPEHATVYTVTIRPHIYIHVSKSTKLLQGSLMEENLVVFPIHFQHCVGDLVSTARSQA